MLVTTIENWYIIQLITNRYLEGLCHRECRWLTYPKNLWYSRIFDSSGLGMVR